MVRVLHLLHARVPIHTASYVACSPAFCTSSSPSLPSLQSLRLQLEGL